MSDSLATQNYGARSNVLAIKDISRATKSTIPCASHSQGTVPRLWFTKHKHHLKTQLVHFEPLTPKCSGLCSGISHMCKPLSTFDPSLHQNRNTHHNFDEWFQSQCSSMGSSLGYPRHEHIILGYMRMKEQEARQKEEEAKLTVQESILSSNDSKEEKEH